MITQDYFDRKAIEEGYDDFRHWLDCSDFHIQDLKLIEWIEAYQKSKVEAISDEQIELLREYTRYLKQNDYFGKPPKSLAYGYVGLFIEYKKNNY